MGLAAGTKLGPYEIVAALGAGGMGEVYRARDTRLDRMVAVKILPAHLATNPDAGERFEREARTISSLNHPNICQLHDVGEQAGVRYLVMELLEGETLSERLRRGPLPLDQVLRYGADIAEGLHAAHRRGVVHRDLKPGNIMLTKSGAKLMDFGLAKGVTPAKPVSDQLTVTMSGTAVTPLTQQGTIVGTFQYMAPEQVEGKEADARSDIFSLGAVLYEMVSGKRAFEGKTMVSVAAAILEKEPEPIRTLQPVTPTGLERVIKRCLAKDPDARWQSAGDLASELKWIAEGSGAAEVRGGMPATGRQRSSSERLAWMLAALAVIAVVVLGIVLGTRGSRAVVRSQIASTDKLQFNFVGDNGGPPVLSPDGKYLVFSARSEGKNRLFVRSMDRLAPEPLAGTEDAIFPFWSPDSRTIAFFSGGKLKRMDLSGGPAITICDAVLSRGASWSTKGIIAFTPYPTQPLFQVPAAGGTPTPLTQLGEKYTTHRWPWFMPDGEHFIYFAASHSTPSNADAGLIWSSLDGKQSKFLMHTLSNAIYVSGYLLYTRENALLAQAFDGRTGEFKGDAVVLNDDTQIDGTVWRGTFTASEDGTLIYQPGTSGGGLRLTWIAADGKEGQTLPGTDAFVEVQMSPDDKKAAVVVGDPVGVIWIYDLVHGTRTRFTFGEGSYSSPVWSRDGKRLAYIAPVDGGKSFAAMVKNADGSGEATQLMLMDSSPHGAQQGLWDWSPDGRYLLFNRGMPGVGTAMDIWVLPLFGDHKPFPYAVLPGEQSFAQFSPDGRWVAYVSFETGHNEVYVAPFPWTGAKWQVSQGDGWQPRWTKSGKEIWFSEVGNIQTFAAPVDGHGSSFEVGQVRVAFESTKLAPGTAGEGYGVTSDGQRFLVIATGDAGTMPLTMIQNWTAELKKK